MELFPAVRRRTPGAARAAREPGLVQGRSRGPRPWRVLTVVVLVTATACSPAGAARRSPPAPAPTTQAPTTSSPTGAAASAADPETTPESLYAALGVSDWPTGGQGLSTTLPQAPGTFPASAAASVNASLAAWMGHAALDRTVWTAPDSQTALKAFTSWMPLAPRDGIAEVWHADPLAAVTFASRFGPGVEVVGNPRVKTAVGSRVDEEGRAAFLLASTTVYVVRFEGHLYPLPVNRQVVLADAMDGSGTAVGDHWWSVSSSAYRARCPDETGGALVPSTSQLDAQALAHLRRAVQAGDRMRADTSRGVEVHDGPAGGGGTCS